MKKIVLLLIVAPIFLITSMNFYGDGDNTHPPYQKAFTCSSCHTTINEGIIIGGKTFKDSLFQNITVRIPEILTYDAIQINVAGVKNPKINVSNPYKTGEYGAIFNLNVNSNQVGKKDNKILIRIPLNEIQANQEIEIQGILSNADGTVEGDYSFYKKIILEPTIKKIVDEIILFPTIASSNITLKNIQENESISIINIEGKLVFSTKSTSREKRIDVSNFPNGYYFLKTNDLTKRFIVKK